MGIWELALGGLGIYKKMHWELLGGVGITLQPTNENFFLFYIIFL